LLGKPAREAKKKEIWKKEKIYEIQMLIVDRAFARVRLINKRAEIRASRSTIYGCGARVVIRNG